MLTSFLNFLYYPIASRLLPVDAYGETQFIVTILFQISVLFLALNIISILIALRYSHDNNMLSRKVVALSSLLNMATSLITLILVLLLCLSYESFNFDNITPFIAMGIAIISTVPFTVGVGTLQGRNQYIRAGTMNAVGAGLKLVCSMVLVLMGGGVMGAVLGIAIGQFAAVIIFSYRGDISLKDLVSFKVGSLRTLRPDRLLIAASVWVIIVNLIMTIDTVGAKMLLSPIEAGQYAGIATLAKIAIFVVSPLMWLVIPSASLFSERRREVFILVTIASVFCLILLLAYNFFGDLIIPIIVGSDYLAMKNLLVLSTFASSLLAIAAMLNVVLFARRLYFHVAIQTIIMIMTVVLAILFYPKGSPLISILFAQALSGGLGIVYYSIIKRTS